MADKVNNFKTFSILTTAATYFLIFVGGLVRVSGAGLGCPDWPKCFGRWIPPTNISQLPSDMDPSLFNFTLAWIEYINRLIGVAIGILIFITAFLAVKNFRDKPKIMYPSILAFILVGYQGWQGGRVVASELEPYLVSIHMATAFIIVSLLIYVSLQAHFLTDQKTAGQSNITKHPRGTILMIGLLWILVIIQVIMGTQVRASIELSARQFPDLNPSAWLDKIGLVGYNHTILGVIVAGLALFIVFRVLRHSSLSLSLIKQSGWSIIGLVFIQLIIGVILFAGTIPPVMQVLHLWVASLITGLCLVFYTAVKKEN